MTVRRRIILLVLLTVVGTISRLPAAHALDGILRLDSLHVDEIEYTRGLEAVTNPPFDRPPGMYLIAWAVGLPNNIIASRILFSVLSLVPAISILAAFGNLRSGIVCAFLATLEPVTAFFGLHLLPAIPASALVSLALLAAFRRRLVAAGFLAGCSMLFRGEVALLFPVLLLIILLNDRRQIKEWIAFTSAAMLAVVPVILINFVSGAGPVVSTNGAENLWIGTDWAIITTPPGVEFESLMRMANPSDRADTYFGAEALHSITRSPHGWAWMGIRKTLASFTFPGPGRNMEVSLLLRRTHLMLLIPLSILIFSLALTRFITACRGVFWERFAASMLSAMAAAAFVFFPAARYRTALFPAAFFLAACSVPSGRELQRWIPIALFIILISLFIPYPGSPRTGLTDILSAQEWLDRDRPDLALDNIHNAATRGFEGADMHNIAGAALSMTGQESEGLGEFLHALRMAPGSPSLWRNTAASLWNMGRYEEAAEAAEKAVYLDPRLREELAPVLEWRESHGI